MLSKAKHLNFSAAPVVMGVLNVTPDSFSDGGQFLSPQSAIARAAQMIVDGAGIIDVGGESTRPGADPVDANEQIQRTAPVIRAIRNAHPDVPISIDTRLSSVAAVAIQAGATMINDVSALRDDPGMANLIAQSGIPVVLMHMRGKPADMQQGGGPCYDNIVEQVRSFLLERVQFARSSGIESNRIVIDPGLGFGKRVEDNLAIMRHLSRFVDTGYPVLLGASRKRFIGKLLGIEEPRQRLGGSLACAAVAVLAGVKIIRVHDVAETVEVIRTCNAIIQQSPRQGRAFLSHEVTF